MSATYGARDLANAIDVILNSDPGHELYPVFGYANITGDARSARMDATVNINGKRKNYRITIQEL